MKTKTNSLREYFAAIGRKGGAKRSVAKAEAARANGRLGGRRSSRSTLAPRGEVAA